MRTKKSMLLSDRRLGLAFLLSAAIHLLVLAILLFQTKEWTPPPVPVTLNYATSPDLPIKLERDPDWNL